ncbi:unnamed protein product, partial [Brachionus calyciflorus]
AEYANGKIPYIIDVDQGNIKINVPLDVPDGINEHQPSIEINYTSVNQVNSFLGHGWSLQGLSVIHLRAFCYSSTKKKLIFPI